jgi:Kinesin motor domain
MPGSGKTFTMTGSQQDPGLTPKAITELFRLIEERRQCNIKVTCYFVELYNDNLVDLFWLLDNSHTKGGGAQEPPRLDIKLDGNKMVFIRNCIIKEVSSYDELMNLFNTGNAERHVGATRMNAESSRSHSIFSILIESYDTATKKTVRGKLSLVDLAGSERADKTGGTAERLKEGQSINKSLSALGDVMAALTEGEKFIPYRCAVIFKRDLHKYAEPFCVTYAVITYSLSPHRNNKLTQLMQDSLGGNAKTLMFVNFSPADYNADETVSSLNFATRVKKVVNKVSQLKENAEAKRLKAEIARLRALVGESAGGEAVELEDADEAAEPEEAPVEAPPPERESAKVSGKSAGASRSGKRK